FRGQREPIDNRPGTTATTDHAPTAKELKRATKSGWSKPSARPGDEVFLAARLTGFQAGTTVLFKVFPTSGDPAAPLANLSGVSDETGIAFVEWAYVHDPVKVKEPKLL